MPVHSTIIVAEQDQDVELDVACGTRHLIHRPKSWDHYLLDAPSASEENFVLAGDLPRGHPLFNDGSGHFHDFQVATEAVLEAGEFIGHQYFGVPDDWSGLFHRFALTMTDVSAWRAQAGRARVAMSIRARPTRAVDGVPCALELDADLEVDGEPCGTVTGTLLFLAPVVRLRSGERSRRALLPAVPPSSYPHTRERRPAIRRRADAAAVGRGDAANVVVTEPVETSHSRLSTYVLVGGSHPVFSAGEGEHVPGMLLIEAVRQTSLLSVGRAHGLTPVRSTLTGLQVNFRGQGLRDAPLRCTAVPGQLGHDDYSRPAVPVALTITQRGRIVAEASALVVQDF